LDGSRLSVSKSNLGAVGGGQTLNINQSGPRFQKVGAQGNLPQSLPAGAIVVNTTAKPGTSQY